MPRTPDDLKRLVDELQEILGSYIELSSPQIMRDAQAGYANARKTYESRLELAEFTDLNTELDYLARQVHLGEFAHFAHVETRAAWLAGRLLRIAEAAHTALCQQNQKFEAKRAAQRIARPDLMGCSDDPPF